jgi:hypothetical protein
MYATDYSYSPPLAWLALLLSAIHHHGIWARWSMFCLDVLLAVEVNVKIGWG